MAEDWAVNVKKYEADADDGVIAGIVRYCGIALQKRDSSLVSFGDPVETGRVRENYLKKKLGLTHSDADLDAAIAKVGERMKGESFRNRVTVYYLLAQHFDLLHTFSKAGSTVAASAKKASDTVVPLAAAGVGAVGAAASGAADKVASVTSGVVGAAGDAVTGVAGAAVAAAGAAGAVAAGAVDKVASVTSGVVGAAGEAVSDVAGSAGAVAAGAASKVASVTSGVIGAAGDAVSDVAGTAGAVATGVLGGAAALAGSVGNTVSGTANALTGDYDDDKKSGLGWLPWLLLALAGLALLWWLFFRTPAAAPAPEAVPAAVETTVAPPAEGTVAIPEGAGVTSETRDGKPVVKVYFDTAKADIVQAFTPAAAGLKAYLDTHAGSTLGVSGFADKRGNAAANAALSKKRAEAVKAALVTSGIADASIELVKPSDAVENTNDLAGARRVEVTVR